MKLNLFDISLNDGPVNFDNYVTTLIGLSIDSLNKISMRVDNAKTNLTETNQFSKEVKDFVKRNKDKGIIWFFESCDLNVLEQLRVIWKLKNAGWFEGVKAVLIGRPLNTTPLFDYDYKQANYEHLKDLNVPVVIDLDIGHTSPNWTIVNGATTHFTFDGKKAKIMFE